MYFFILQILWNSISKLSGWIYKKNNSFPYNWFSYLLCIKSLVIIKFMTAQINKKFCFKISLVYYASILFANLMIMFIPMATVTFPTVNEDSMGKWIAFTDENQWLINIITVLCFVIPSAICLKECFSILFAK